MISESGVRCVVSSPSSGANWTAQCFSSNTFACSHLSDVFKNLLQVLLFLTNLRVNILLKVHFLRTTWLVFKFKLTNPNFNHKVQKEILTRMSELQWHKWASYESIPVIMDNNVLCFFCRNWWIICGVTLTVQYTLQPCPHLSWSRSSGQLNASWELMARQKVSNKALYRRVNQGSESQGFNNHIKCISLQRITHGKQISIKQWNWLK